MLLPPLVKRYFPDRVGLLTSLYVTALSVSTFVPPLVAVPVAEAAGWQVSLGEWGVVAAARARPVDRAGAASARRREPASLPEEAESGPAQVRGALAARVGARDRCSPIPGINAYAMFAWLPPILHDIAGTSPAEAGALLSLFAAMGLPASIVVPVIAARYGHVRLLVGIAIVSFAAGYLGLLLVPATATWLWVALPAPGRSCSRSRSCSSTCGAAPTRARSRSRGSCSRRATSSSRSARSRWGCCTSPTGGWTWPLIFLASSTVPAAIAGAIAARPRYFEDERAA